MASLAGLAFQAPDLREAARLDRAGRCEESEPIYRRALAQGVPGPSLLNNVGNHYLACRQPEKAREYFEKLTAAAPGHLNGNLQLARLDMSGGRFNAAEERLARVAPSHADDFEVQFLLGRAAGRAGHPAKAKDALEAALRIRPDEPAALFEAGLANAAAGDYPRAVFLLARAQSRAPGEPSIALALARAAEDAGYYGDAVLAYERYLTLRPEDRAARRDKARALALTANRAADGARELADYVANNPRDPLGRFYHAQVIWKQDPDAALAQLAEAVSLDPKLAQAHVARAWLLHRQGRAEEALPHLDAALRIASNDVRALDLRGVVLLSLDRARDAEASLRRAVAIAPDDADAALHLGRALVDQGKDAEGQRWLDAYQKLRPARQRDARRESGMIELATLDPAGRRAREIERFRAMARSRPDDPLLLATLAGLLLEDGQREEALREYRTLESRNADAAVQAQAGRALAEAGEREMARRFLIRAGLPPDAEPEAEVALKDAVELALRGSAVEADERLRRIQSRWPAWGRPWVVRGLLAREARRTAESAAWLRTAAALGAREDLSRCATLREWVSGACRK